MQRSPAPRAESSVLLGDSILYACPRDHLPVKEQDGWLIASGSGRRYPIREGAPDFRAVQAHENGEAEHKLERLNALALEAGWQAALAAVYRADEKMWQYITRAPTFLDLLPLERNSVVLEIGPGLGQFTGAIAARVAELYALEVSPGQAQFVTTRCRQDHLERVHVAIGGDDTRLPYLSSSFDTVICNLVLEWCAARNLLEPFRTGQERLLAECARVLRPGGTLYLATKNRFALLYMLGWPDEHVDGMRFGNALPRWALRAALRLKGKKRPTGLLHSHRELAKMLQQAGLENIESFWAAPEMRFPDRYISTRPEAIRAARRQGGLAQGHTRLTRLVMPRVPAHLVHHVMPGLVFIARTPALPATHGASRGDPTQASRSTPHIDSPVIAGED